MDQPKGQNIAIRKETINWLGKVKMVIIGKLSGERISEISWEYTLNGNKSGL